MESLEPFETDYYQDFIDEKKYQRVPYLQTLQLSEATPRLDQLSSFQNSIVGMSENQKNLMSGSIFEQAFFLVQIGV